MHSNKYMSNNKIYNEMKTIDKTKTKSSISKKKKLIDKNSLMHLFSNVENLPMNKKVRENMQMNYTLNPLYLYTNDNSYTPKLVPNHGQTPVNLQSTNYKDLQTDLKKIVSHKQLYKENFQMDYTLNPLYLYTNYNSYTPKVVPNHGQTPIDLQSTNYKDLQTDLKKIVSHKQLFKENFNNIEGNNGNGNNENNNLNNNLNLNSTNFVDETKNVLKTTTPSLSQVNANKKNLLSYHILLEDYQKLVKKTQDLIKNYTNSLNPKLNTYLGKNIKFPNGFIAYVTNLGVVKPYPNGVFEMNAGKYGCPANIPIPIDIPWNNTFLTPKTVISEAPYLIAGTKMQTGQSCGNEGKNILISSLFGREDEHQSLSYIGCYSDSLSSPVMDYLKPINSFDPSSNQIYSFEECKNSARMNGYNYFGLQNVNPSTYKGICSLSNDLSTATSLGAPENSNSNCFNLFNSDLLGGSTGSNAIYNISPVADKSQINKIFFVNPNSELLNYPANDVEFNTEYTMFHNYDSSYNNISTTGNSTINDCKTSCDTNLSCAGFVFDRDNQTCNIKTNEMWPYGSGKAIPTTNSDIYMRHNSIRQAPYNISTETTKTDSLTASHYINNKININEVNADQLLLKEKINIYTYMKEIELLESKITSIAEQLTIENIYLDENNEILYQESLKDKEILNEMLNEYNNIINKKAGTSSIGILNDTNIVITQKNYSYIMWSMFAIGLILITFSVLHKK